MGTRFPRLSGSPHCLHAADGTPNAEPAAGIPPQCRPCAVKPGGRRDYPFAAPCMAGFLFVFASCGSIRYPLVMLEWHNGQTGSLENEN